MNKNEIKKFFNNYAHTVCLDENLEPIKILDMDETSTRIEYLILTAAGEKRTIVPHDKLIALKGRLKERDYNYVEARFNKQWNS